MTKMEIATYLGMNNALLANTLNEIEDKEDIMLKIVQAVQEAQLIMYELARKDLMDALTESEK